MESFKIENLSFTYPEREQKAIDNISLEIGRGEFITLCGKSGSGKTTLLRLLKSSLSPCGILEGEISFEGKSLFEIDQKTQAEKIGLVMQNPDNQIVTDKVWHELAFGLESLGYSSSEIRGRVSEMASFFGMESWFHKEVNQLSGGQKQLLNLASVMATSPSVLILDEPTSQLDPISAQEFVRVLEKINRELGVTVILSEHRLFEAFPISDRVIVMDEGKIIADDSPKNVGETLKRINHDMYHALPAPMRVYGEVDGGMDYPVTVRDGRMWLENYAENHPLKPVPENTYENNGEAVVELKDVYFRYQRDLPYVIKGMNLKISKGETFAILGGNGTGKTTALSLISGLNKPRCGRVYIKGEEISKIENLYNGILGVLPQNPQSIFVKNTVYQDLLDVLSGVELSKEEKDRSIKNMAKLCRIDGLLESHPYDLSGGEQQRAALAKVLLKSPEILLLDEPTKGLDAHFKHIFANIIADLKKQGKTIVLVSHDIEFCAEHADMCAMVFDGSITSIDTPREFFAGKTFYTTAANRMARTVLPRAIIPEDIIRGCGKKPIEIKIDKSIPDALETVVKTEKNENTKLKTNKTKIPGHTVLATILVLLAIPLTLYLGLRFGGGRKYYFTSLLIILEAMMPFYLIFEGKKPKAREVVVISVLCAIAVIGRTAFFMLPQFKPVLALIIIAGVCLGGETGFLVGALTGFVSNFFFGQGPWTPWQMFTMGLIGFLAGILFGNRKTKKRKLSLCVFGFISTIVIYGGIMNPASIIMWQDNITIEMMLSTYAAGLPLDIVHALSTAVFLLFISEPMIEKIERVKIKYGLLDR